MNSPRIKITHAYGEVCPNVWSDFAWIRENRKTLLEQYGECIILVYEKHVIGTGQTLDEAVEDADRHLPDEVEQITPVTEFLRHHNPFWRVRPILLKPEQE